MKCRCDENSLSRAPFFDFSTKMLSDASKRSVSTTPNTWKSSRWESTTRCKLSHDEVSFIFPRGSFFDFSAKMLSDVPNRTFQPPFNTKTSLGDKFEVSFWCNLLSQDPFFDFSTNMLSDVSKSAISTTSPSRWPFALLVGSPAVNAVYRVPRTAFNAL